MKWWRKRGMLATLLSGAWLGTTITCNPGAFDAVIDIFDDGGYIIIDDRDRCGWCWWEDDDDFRFDFDFEFDD